MFFPTYHTGACIHPGKCSSSSHNNLHDVCPCCGATPDPTVPCYCSGPVAGYLPCLRGGTVHEARIVIRDPDNIDHYLLPHEYAVCDSCHKKQDELKASGHDAMLAGAFSGS